MTFATFVIALTLVSGLLLLFHAIRNSENNTIEDNNVGQIVLGLFLILASLTFLS